MKRHWALIVISAHTQSHSTHPPQKHTIFARTRETISTMNKETNMHQQQSFVCDVESSFRRPHWSLSKSIIDHVTHIGVKIVCTPKTKNKKKKRNEKENKKRFHLFHLFYCYDFSGRTKSRHARLLVGCVSLITILLRRKWQKWHNLKWVGLGLVSLSCINFGAKLANDVLRTTRNEIVNASLPIAFVGKRRGTWEERVCCVWSFYSFIISYRVDAWFMCVFGALLSLCLFFVFAPRPNVRMYGRLSALTPWMYAEREPTSQQQLMRLLFVCIWSGAKCGFAPFITSIVYDVTYVCARY